MRINYLRSSAILVWCLAFFSACSTIDGLPPSIDITDTVHLLNEGNAGHLEILIDLEDDNYLQEYHVLIKSRSGLTYFEEHSVVNTASHSIKYAIDLTTTSTKEYIIDVVATDNEDHSSKEQIKISLD